MRPAPFPLALALCAALVLAASSRAVETADDVVSCMSKNQPEKSAVQTVRMIATDRMGADTATRGKMYWQKGADGLSRIFMRFDEPPDLRDAALLMLEKKDGESDTFMYLPELGKTRRVTTHMMSGSMFGTDFSYEDFAVLQGVADTSAELGEVADLEGRSAFMLVQQPAPEARSDYDRIVTYVDRETCLLRRAEFFGKGGTLRKLLDVDWSSVEQVGRHWFPKRIVQKDEIEGTHTTLLIEEIEVDVDLPTRMFSRSALERRR